MARQWNVGDVVQLKSGGPIMTVTETGEYQGKITIWCTWFKNGDKAQDTFPPESLTTVDDE